MLSVISSLLFGLAIAFSASNFTPIVSLNVHAEINEQSRVEITQAITLAQADNLNWQISKDAENIAVRADGNDVEYSVTKRNNRKIITSRVAAADWSVSFQTGGIIRNNNRDQLFYVISERYDSDIANAVFSLDLSKVKDGDLSLNGNTYLLGGSQDALPTKVGDARIDYYIDFVSAGDTLTVNASWDAGAVKYLSGSNIRLLLQNLELIPWLTIGLLLPLLSYLILFALRRYYNRSYLNSTPNNKLSTNISATIAGTIFQRKINGAVIAATILDLCSRGFVVVIRKNGRYFLAPKNPPSDDLYPWESALLDSLFASSDKQSSESVSEIARKSLYSKSVSEGFLLLYDTLTQRGIFLESPHISRIKAKLIGLLIYCIAIVAVGWTVITDSQPALLLPAGATLFIARSIFSASNGVARLSKLGEQTTIELAGLKSFLSLESAISKPSTALFEQFLPYAVALGVEQQWANRFTKASTAISSPEWLISYEQHDASLVAVNVGEFVAQISKAIESMRGPKVS